MALPRSGPPMTEAHGWEAIRAGARIRRFRVAAACARVRAAGRVVRLGCALARRHLLASSRRCHARRSSRDLGRRGRPASAAGRATLLRFGPPELRHADGIVSCRYAIEGGLLALRAGGSVKVAQRRDGAEHELSVTVEEYVPRLNATINARLRSALQWDRRWSLKDFENIIAFVEHEVVIGLRDLR